MDGVPNPLWLFAVLAAGAVWLLYAMRATYVQHAWRRHVVEGNVPPGIRATTPEPGPRAVRRRTAGD